MTMKNVLSSSVTLVLKRATRRNISEDGILHSKDYFIDVVLTPYAYRYQITSVNVDGSDMSVMLPPF
jgi:hypothetical protein